MRAFLAALTFCLFLCGTGTGEASRAQKHWGGKDFPFSCDTVRSWRSEINAMSAETKADLTRQFNITRKQRRQAMACLRRK